MKITLGILIIVLAMNKSFSADFGINAKYSFGIGMPIPNIEDKVFTTLSDGLNITSESECLRELNDETLSKFALAQAMQAGATDVVIKCTKYWSDEKCDSIYPGCINSADIGQAKHLHIYNSKSIVPSYLRIEAGSYFLLQSILYTKDKNGDGKHDVSLVSQTKFDAGRWSKIVGDNPSCTNTINNSIVTSIIYNQVFSDQEALAVKLVCYEVNEKGYSSSIGENTLKRKDN